MGFCFELGPKFQANTMVKDGEEYLVRAHKGMFTLMTINKNWQSEMTLEEKVDLVKKNLDKAMYNQTRNTTVIYTIKFSEAEENLGMIPTYCVTGLVKMGFGAT